MSTSRLLVSRSIYLYNFSYVTRAAIDITLLTNQLIFVSNLQSRLIVVFTSKTRVPMCLSFNRIPAQNRINKQPDLNRSTMPILMGVSQNAHFLIKFLGEKWGGENFWRDHLGEFQIKECVFQCSSWASASIFLARTIAIFVYRINLLVWMPNVPESPPEEKLDSSANHNKYACSSVFHILYTSSTTNLLHVGPEK